MTVEIGQASVTDAEAIRSIYAFHVLNGTASFDTVPPDLPFWQDKIGYITERGWPFIACREDGRVLGYAYATQFRDRPAYARTCEDSIYVADRERGRGIGKLLLAELLKQAQACGFEQMIAVIGGGEPASVALHSSLGFTEAGRMRDVGFKFGRRLDTVYMQRSLRN
ncbi:GNAT family N-acetyltransferase [Altererythrobacter sp. Z27]|uniref:GNAT family N-acetyltransferase n=1 Tax=Altererythrobacter sp. Z27 TaxID=3461147 RepID=UPI004043CF61